MPTIEGASQEAAAEALEDVASKAREVLASSSRFHLEVYSQLMAADFRETLKSVYGKVIALESVAGAEPARAMTASESVAEAGNVRENLSRLVERLESATNLRGHGPDRRPAVADGDSGSADQGAGTLTPDESQFISETLKRIGEQGLDDPNAHLEFVRRHLRAAVA